MRVHIVSLRPPSAVGQKRGLARSRAAFRYGVLSAFLCLAAGLSGCNQEPEPETTTESRRWNVVLVVVDTLAAEHTSLHDSSLGTTPSLEALASEGISFTDVRSTAPWTLPATASLMTGLYPGKHEMIRFGGRIASGHPTLAGVMKGAGYQTAAFVGNALVKPERGFGSGFDRWQDLRSPVSSQNISDAAIEWLEQREGDEPFLLYLHYMDPHEPYAHHAEFDRTKKLGPPPAIAIPGMPGPDRGSPVSEEDIHFLTELYREEIAYTDFHIGRVLEQLEARGLRETTIVVVTADHGEEFLQHGDLGHGWSLYQELLHVPLVVALPREPASMFEGPFKGSVDAPVSIVDVAPTVLDLLGLGQEPSMDGRSLVPLLIDRAESDSWPERGLFFETIWGEHVEIAADLPQPGERPQGDSGGWVKGPERPIRANYRTGLAEKQLKILHDQLADSWELFDLSQDPLEKRNLFGGHPQERQLLERLLQMESRFGASPESRLAKPAAVEMDAEEIEELAALGYLE